jgi:phosphohistidine phosphatase
MSSLAGPGLSGFPTRTLWLLRHAKAVADPPPGGEDFDRVLAPRGRRDATALGRLIGRDVEGIESNVPLPQVAFVSPAARTKATAELVFEGMGVPARVEFPMDMYGGDPEDVLNHLRRLGDNVTSAMVVLHNPTGQFMARELLTADDEDGLELAVRRGFPTCALGIYLFEVVRWADVQAHTAVLEELLIPPFGP